FKMVSPRTETSRCPRTENTTAGSVGATAVASSTEAYQGRPNAACASTAVAATVRNVPATPVTVTGTAADRNRDQPICIPPSNKMHTSATVTSRSTTRCGGSCSAGMTLTATAAPASTSADDGIFTRSVSRFDSTTTRPTAAASSTTRAKGPASVTGSPTVRNH